MARRSLQVNWIGIDGAARHRRKLHLKPNGDSMFICPVTQCLHVGFKSGRGLRKHIDTKHSWYYYFDEQPEIKREEIVLQQPVNKRACTLHKASFSITEGIGLQFTNWLCTPCGGGKSMKQAKQSAQRGMKFLMACLEDGNNDSRLTADFVDCCLGTPSMIMNFLKLLENDWKLSSSASLNYLTSISDLLDFRKSSGVSDSSLRCFAVTEVYIRRGKENLGKRKRLEYTRNLDLETLIAKNSWATLNEMEMVIPYHIQRFKTVIEKCKSNDRPCISDLTFLTRFVATYLFIRVKCSRPMTYQFLTVSMIAIAKRNGGYIDQKEFKTADQFLFDTIIIDDEVMDVLDIYIDCVRPMLNPSCDYVLVTLTGKQYTAFSSAMSILVHEAIGKYIHPTRYRQIVETESVTRLSPEEQQIISKDQKHSSHVAKVAYQKHLSRDVAMKGRKCMEKLVGDKRNETNETMINVIRDINKTASTFDQRVLEEAQNILTSANRFPSADDLTITKTIHPQIVTSCPSKNENVISKISNDVEFKKEVVNDFQSHVRSKVKFSKEEDIALSNGIKKYGKGNWTQILNDPDFNFHECRNRDSLRMRCDTATYKRNVIDLTV